MADSGVEERTVAGLVGLDARAWAQLLRALRRLPELPGPVAGLLDLPTSALAAGARRSELCRLLGPDARIVEALLADPALPAAAHAVLEPVMSADSGTASASDDGAGDEGSAEDGVERATARQRDLRREVAELRRQRDGAEVRASVAEARVTDAEQERVVLEERVAALEAELRQAREDVAQAVARAERRAAARTDELERALASERSALEVIRRERDRGRVELDGARAELAELRSRPVVERVPAAVRTRPLVLPEELAPDTTEAARWLLAGVRVLLVDGYNVSLALRAGYPLIEQRRWLVERLRPLAIRGSAAPVIVFDGEGQGRTQRDPSGVEVRFTASGTIADDEIVFAVAATDDPVLVITDDVELQQRVRAEGGNVLGTVHLLGAIEG
jgi:hypothetical protein